VLWQRFQRRVAEYTFQSSNTRYDPRWQSWQPLSVGTWSWLTRSLVQLKCFPTQSIHAWVHYVTSAVVGVYVTSLLKRPQYVWWVNDHDWMQARVERSRCWWPGKLGIFKRLVAAISVLVRYVGTQSFKTVILYQSAVKDPSMNMSGFVTVRYACPKHHSARSPLPPKRPRCNTHAPEKRSARSR